MNSEIPWDVHDELLLFFFPLEQQLRKLFSFWCFSSGVYGVSQCIYTHTYIHTYTINHNCVYFGMTGENEQMVDEREMSLLPNPKNYLGVYPDMPASLRNTALKS